MGWTVGADGAGPASHGCLGYGGHDLRVVQGVVFRFIRVRLAGDDQTGAQLVKNGRIHRWLKNLSLVRPAAPGEPGKFLSQPVSTPAEDRVRRLDYSSIRYWKMRSS